MKKLNLILLALFTVFEISAQAPQGFNYQAVARDGDGQALASETITVRIAIIKGTTLIWQEDHIVETNDFGLFSLVIGANDEGKTGGSAASFGDIKWGDGSFSLNISVNGGSGFRSMGNAPLMSVPYALYANNGGGGGSEGNWSLNEDTLYTEGSVGIGTSLPGKSLLSVQSTDPQVEKPLFEVRNDLGNPVFAVFNDGVMVYVDEEKKGVKGGFAVGGYNSGKKGVTQEFMRITPDSVRIWVPDDNAGKGAKGGFAVGGYNTASKASTNNYLEITREKTNIFFDTTSLAKGFKGGFAVGGYNSAKAGDPNQLMSLTSANYLIGQDAGLNITSGRNNTFFGWKAGLNNTEGSNNIFIGKSSGISNTYGNVNIFLGNASGASNTSGSRNVMLGDSAGYENTFGYNNIFMGNSAGYSNENGDYNIYMGYRAGASQYTGISNIYIGDEAGSETDTSSNQVFIGDWAGAFASAGDNNIFIGGQAGRDAAVENYNTFIGSFAGVGAKGDRNTALGNWAGYYSTGSENLLLGVSAGYGTEADDYSHNTYVGPYSGYSTTTGSDNVFLGYAAGNSNTTASDNVFLGYASGYNNTTGENNVIVGHFAGFNNVSGSDNIFLGDSAGFNSIGSDKLYIDNSGTSTPLIYGDFQNNNLSINGNMNIEVDRTNVHGLVVDIPSFQEIYYAVYAYGSYYATGGYFVPSDAAFKNNISNISDPVRRLSKINGVSYEYIQDSKKGLPQGSRLGVIAQELEKEFPELVREDEKGMKAVNYDGLIPVLIEAVKDQQTQIEQQQAEIDALRELIESMNQ